MPDYKATNISGTSYQRANRVVIDNPREGVKSISFDEEQVLTVGSDTVSVPVSNLFYGLRGEFTPENAATAFPLLDINGDPTGSTATYMDAYLLLSSLYYHLATERDGVQA